MVAESRSHLMKCSYPCPTNRSCTTTIEFRRQTVLRCLTSDGNGLPHTAFVPVLQQLIDALLPSLISSSPLPHPEPTASPSIIEKRNFKDSCNNIGFDGRYLTADCRTFAGNYVHNQVDLNNCIGDSRGVLTHPGSGFASQCQNWEHWASTIRGLCLDSGHVLRYTEIDIGFIENQNGVLAGC